MAKRKRSAEDLAHLIVKAARLPPCPFSVAPLPPFEWAQVSTAIRSISRNNRRRLFVRSAVIQFLTTAAMLGSLFWMVRDDLRFVFGGLPWILLFFWTWLVGLSLILMERAFCTRMFVRGFVQGLRLREPGAPKKWTTEVCKEAVAAVQAVVAETRLSVARSIDILKKRNPERWQSLSEQRYYEAVQRLRDL
jgi:hypothetical protein